MWGRKEGETGGGGKGTGMEREGESRVKLSWGNGPTFYSFYVGVEGSRPATRRGEQPFSNPVVKARRTTLEKEPAICDHKGVKTAEGGSTQSPSPI